MELCFYLSLFNSLLLLILTFVLYKNKIIRTRSINQNNQDHQEIFKRIDDLEKRIYPFIKQLDAKNYRLWRAKRKAEEEKRLLMKNNYHNNSNAKPDK